MTDDELLELMACAMDGGLSREELRVLFPALAARSNAQALIARAVEFSQAMSDLNGVFERAPLPPNLLPRIIAAAAAGAVAELNLETGRGEAGRAGAGWGDAARAPGPGAAESSREP